MRIACIDNSAAERVSLQKLVEKAYHESRDTLGHLSFPTIFPATKDELLLNTAPDILIFGSGFSVDRLITLARELQGALKRTKFCFFLKPENYTLRNLQRLEQFSSSVFSTNDPLVRVVHALVFNSENKETSSSGKLIVVTGVKGGVGTTSIVSGLAHAAEAIGKKAVVLDLSEKSVFSIYMGLRKTQSADYSSALRDNILIDQSFIDKCLVEAPNGINLFLPPAGGNEIRELWLKETTELSIAIVDYLLEQFDLVIVDRSSAEGLLPYALNCRASSRVLVTSNDPASIHLLNINLQEMFDLPGKGRVKVILNRLDERGLAKKELVNILRYGGKDELDLALLSFDSKGKNWVGTGNTFYTESSTVTQTLLEEMTFALCGEVGIPEISKNKIFQVLRKILKLPEYFAKPQSRLRLLTFDNNKEISKKEELSEKPLYQPPVRRTNVANN